MLGSSRWSLDGASAALIERSRTSGAESFVALSADLFAVANVLDANLDLRRMLSDSGTALDRRTDLVRTLFAGKIAAVSVEVFEDIVGRRWSHGGELVDATEIVGAQAGFLAADAAGRIDTVEDELYRVSRIVGSSAELRTALTDRWMPAENKLALVRDLFAGKVDPQTLAVVEQLVGSPRGRRFESAVDDMAKLAAERHSEVMAEAHVARPLVPEQSARLAAALQAIYGRPVRLTEIVDPDVVGGVKVVVGDEVIDGSVARRLAQAKQQLTG